MQISNKANFIDLEKIRYAILMIYVCMHKHIVIQICIISYIAS